MLIINRMMIWRLDLNLDVEVHQIMYSIIVILKKVDLEVEDERTYSKIRYYLRRHLEKSIL